MTAVKRKRSSDDTDVAKEPGVMLSGQEDTVFSCSVMALGKLVCETVVAPPLEVPPEVLAPAFPRVLSICGFVPSSLIPCPPSVSVHTMVPSGSSTEAQCGFFSMLLRTLISGHLHAVVALDKDWLAVITAPFSIPFPPVQSQQQQLLYLHILAPGTEIPGIGKLIVDSSSSYPELNEAPMIEEKEEWEE